MHKGIHGWVSGLIQHVPDASSGHDVGGCADREDDECAQTHEDLVVHGESMMLTLFIKLYGAISYSVQKIGSYVQVGCEGQPDDVR